jgi:hypothetical protein
VGQNGPSKSDINEHISFFTFPMPPDQLEDVVSWMAFEVLPRMFILSRSRIIFKLLGLRVALISLAIKSL